MVTSAPDRQRRILELLEGREFFRNSALATLFEVTPMTVWRDLVALEEQGLVRRAHGRVTRTDVRLVEPDFQSKADRSLNAKDRIARFVARHLIQEGDSLAIDGGTTVAALARQALPARLTILTNSLHTARAFLAHPSRPAVYACGGLLREQSGTFIGREALSFFGRRKARKYLLSATGVDIEAGVTDLTLEDNEVKQAMASACHGVILLADRSKFGEISLMQVLPWRRIHRVVTDAPKSQLARLKDRHPHLDCHKA